MYFRVTVLSSELVVVACGRYKLVVLILVALVLGKLMRNLTLLKLKRKCLEQRSGFGYQITAASAACYIAFFSLLWFKYGTLTHKMRSADDVVAIAHACLPEG